MELMHKLFFRRFSTEKFKQFREIYLEESKQLRKRVQFIVGLMFYFLLRAFGFKDLQWPSTGAVVACIKTAKITVLLNNSIISRCYSGGWIK